MLHAMRFIDGNDITTRLSTRVAQRLGLPVAMARTPEITRLVDAYLTLAAQRLGRSGSPSDDALWTLWRHAGETYPPALVDALILAVGERS